MSPLGEAVGTTCCAPVARDARGAILDAVRTSPGLPLGSLRARCGMGWGGIYHHLRALKAAGLVKIEVAGRKHRVFPAGEHASDEAAGKAAGLRLPGATTRLRIASVVAARPGIGAAQIAQELSLAEGLVRHHLRGLAKDGLVARPEAKTWTVEPAPCLLGLLEDVAARPLGPRVNDLGEFTVRAPSLL